MSPRSVTTSVEQGIATILIDQPGEKVNTMDLAFIEDFEVAVAALQPDLQGIILASGKHEQFVAGADLAQILLAESPDDPADVVRRLQRVLDRLQSLPVPSVAAINGPALGGGFELALACDYRVCVESEGNLLGLPEVQLGLLPAGGGCQRLPRLIGLSRALGLILEGKRFTPRRGKRYGAIDEVVHPAVLMEAARTWPARGKRSGHPTWTLLDRAAERSRLIRSIVYRQAEEAVRAKTHGHYPAPLRALDAVRAGQEQGIAAGGAAEAVAFGDLVTGPVARQLIDIFFATEGLKKESRQMARLARPLERVGVVGAGFMGAGIAQAAAVAGYSVRVKDTAPEAVARGLRTARSLTEGAARKGRFSRTKAAEIVSRLSGATDYSGFSRADLVVEAVFEDLAVKRAVIADLEATVAPHAVIATNTSSIPIGRLAAGAIHPERIVGMHFFSPVHKMPLLEVVRSHRSSDEAIATAVKAGAAMGKTVIVVGDGPGFYTTRVLAFMIGEAGALFAEGASIESIDRAMTGFGFPVGPLALTDEVGIDVAAHIADVLAAAFPDRFSAGAIARLLADGRLGRKNGRGFYDYSGKKKRPDPGVYSLRPSGESRAYPAGLIQRRLALAFVNEAARCLQEGIIGSPRDGDIGAIMGLGFPPFLGGPFRYADTLGPGTVVAESRRMAHAYGEHLAPAPILVEMAGANGTFYPPPITAQLSEAPAASPIGATA